MMGIHFTWKHDYENVVNAAAYLYNHMWNDGLRPRIHWGKLSPFPSEERMSEVYGYELFRLKA